MSVSEGESGGARVWVGAEWSGYRGIGSKGIKGKEAARVE